MPGDDWQKFANLRALLGYQWLFPGKKLLFMGGEIGQSDEWNENAQLDWWLLDAGPFHRGLQKFVEDLNQLYIAAPRFGRPITTTRVFTGLTAPTAKTASSPSCAKMPTARIRSPSS